MSTLFEIARVSGCGLIGKGVSLSNAASRVENEQKEKAYLKGLEKISGFFEKGKGLPTEDGMVLLRAALKLAEEIRAFTWVSQVREEIFDRQDVGKRLASYIRETKGEVKVSSLKGASFVMKHSEEDVAQVGRRLRNLEVAEKQRQIELAWKEMNKA